MPGDYPGTFFTILDYAEATNISLNSATKTIFSFTTSTCKKGKTKYPYKVCIYDSLSLDFIFPFLNNDKLTGLRINACKLEIYL